MKHSKWESKKQEIIDLFVSGKCLRDVAPSYGITFQGLSYVCQDLGIDIKAIRHERLLALAKERSDVKKANKQFLRENKHLRNVYNSMKQRCYNKNNPLYKYYGARNIKIHQSWLDDKTIFIKWALANGFNKIYHIDRENNDGNYEPSNCRWVLPIVNQNNRRPKKRKTDLPTGVSKVGNRYSAQICMYGKQTYLGTWDTIEAAVKQRECIRRIYELASVGAL